MGRVKAAGPAKWWTQILGMIFFFKNSLELEAQY